MANNEIVKLGEALEILENARQAIEKSDKSEQTKARLHKALSDAQDLEYAHAEEQARKSWIKGERKNPDVMVARSAEYTKNANGERKTRMRSGHYSPKTSDEKVAASIARHNNKKTNEALDLLEQIYDYAENLFELDYEEKQNISPNKVSKVKKDKDGNEVEVVSVADELFPHEGNAKQQFNQKILDKINDMIEGSGSLEDLIQFVRKGAPIRKTAHESYEEAIRLLEAIVSEDKNIFGKETGKGDLLNDVDTALGSPVKKAVSKIKNSAHESYEEVLSLLEELINEVSYNRLKQAAANSIPLRKAQRDRAKDIYANSTSKPYSDREQKELANLKRTTNRLEHAQSLGGHTGSATFYEPSDKKSKALDNVKRYEKLNKSQQRDELSSFKQDRKYNK